MDEPAQDITITIAPSPSGTLTITVTGDLERDTATTFRHRLAGILDGHHAGDPDLDLDLSAVDFCDLTGLRTLLVLGQTADCRDQVRITAASPAVDVLLQLCQIASLLGYTPPLSSYRH